MIFGYSVLIVAASLLGGMVPHWFQVTHLRMQLTLSFVGGFMLGISLLHLLPHSLEEGRSIDTTFIACLVGLMGMFLLIRTFHFHQHGPTTGEAPEDGCVLDASEHHCSSHDDHQHDHHHGHDHSHHDPSTSHAHSLPGLSWAGVTMGLSIHTLLDGVALGAAIAAGMVHQAWLPGFSVFMAIMLHKPLDALSITTLMQTSGWSFRDQIGVSIGFAMMCPLGAVLFALGAEQLAHRFPFQGTFIGAALGLSAGIFLCISLSDLLPEVQFHQHDRFKLSSALIAGVIAAWAIGFLEPAHDPFGSKPNADSSTVHEAQQSGERLVAC